jgi:hypothetical protein
METSRRVFATAAAPLAYGSFLLGCTALTPAATASIQQILGVAGAVINFAGPIVSVLSAFVPGASAFVPLIESGLNAALAVANTIVTTMTTSAAQPLVQQISTDAKGAIAAAGQAIAVIPDPTARAKVQAILDQASAGVTLLDAFVSGVAVVINPPTVASRMGSTLIPPLRIVTLR